MRKIQALAGASLGAFALLAGCTTTESKLEQKIETEIASGRALLDDQRPEEAEQRFETAAALEGGSLRTRMWVLRAWMDEGRSNDTLDALDALDRAGHDGPEMDYLYGMAFARRAEGHIAAGVTDASIRMNFEDGRELLRSAVAADPERFRDGFLPLARAAWYTQDLEAAREAIDTARTYYPDDPEVLSLAGRIALSQFQASKDPESRGPADWSSEARAHWESARDAFERCAAALADPSTDEERTLAADVDVQLGHTLLWNGERERAAEAYAQAMGLVPQSLDYAQIRSLLAPAEPEAPPTLFLSALESGEQAFVERFSADASQDAVLLWWLGYTRWECGRPAAAEEALAQALEKAPEFTNTWFYLALARYDQEDWDGAFEALARGWEQEPAAMIAAAQDGDQELNVAKVGYLVGRRVEAGDNVGAALLSELCAETALDDPAYWSDLGLFLRDEGERLRASEDATEQALAADSFERAFTAYGRALELAPEDPQILNDTAVMLHYYLKRDLETARALYERAQEHAEALLADETLDPELRPIVETALRDATNNLAALSRGETDEAPALPPAEDGTRADEDPAQDAGAAGPTAPEATPGAEDGTDGDEDAGGPGSDRR